MKTLFDVIQEVNHQKTLIDANYKRLKTIHATTPPTPDGKWHCAVRSPEGYGFDLAFDSELEFLSMMDSIKDCANDPEGLSAHLQYTTEILAPNVKVSRPPQPNQ